MHLFIARLMIYQTTRLTLGHMTSGFHINISTHILANLRELSLFSILMSLRKK
jgi:hypothetical protein